MGLKHILLVENDMNLCQSILLILERAGYLVTAPDCVYDAMETIQAGGYHMLIADFDEPGTREVILTIVRHKFPALPLVILTELSGVEREWEDTLKNTHYLVKPIAPEDLLECVGDFFNNNRSASKINLGIHFHPSDADGRTSH